MVKVNEQRQAIFSLHVQPHFSTMPTITGSTISKQAGTLLHGHYTMRYDLPGGDCLQLVANHNRSQAQVFLLTHDPEKLRSLPGKRPSSLVAGTIATLNRYLIRSDSYAQPRSMEQQAKYDATRQAIQSLSLLLERERNMGSTDWSAQERLRTEVITIIETCRDTNRLIANNPVITEGALGNLLYDLRQRVQQYEYNRVYPVTKLDQLDFSDQKTANHDKQPCFVWDSDLHIGHDELALKDTLRAICQTYGLDPGTILTNQPANRFDRMNRFFHQLWQDGLDWVAYLSQSSKPKQKHTVKTVHKGISSTDVAPYYCFDGQQQERYNNVNDMVTAYSGRQFPGLQADNRDDALSMLNCRANGEWVSIRGTNQIIIRLNDEMRPLRYARDHEQFFLLPNGDDLERLSQISKKHLFLLEKIYLGFKTFITRVPAFFKYLYKHLRHALTVELPDDWRQHIHSNHPARERVGETRSSLAEQNQNGVGLSLDSLHDVLTGQGLMSSGQTLEDFVRQHLENSQYVIVREQHPPSPTAYNNPLHRSLSVLRHFSAYFVESSEKNPIVGTLALAVYFYAAGAVIAPQTLTAILTKLHMSGLIAGIKPTQEFGKWMSNGTLSEAISAAVTYWQGIITAGDLDNFLIQAITVLRDDPAEVAIIVTLAIAIGYGLCRAIPAFQEEMGPFPYPNYATLGAKFVGAPVYDTIMHPGDDWLLGSMKWFMRGVMVLSKLLIAPFIEGRYYGYHDGFLSGWRKSGALLVKTLKQTIAALVDLTLAIATIPFLEFTAMMIHVPFRGVTNALSRSLGLLGHWQPIGGLLLSVANRKSRMDYLSGYHHSQFYGFDNPVRQYVDNRILNGFIIVPMLIILPTAQLLKNIAILPALEIMSLSIRVGATLLDPLSRLLMLAAGKALVLSGYVWDNSVGILLRTLAEGVTLSSNWLDNKAGAAKQFILEKIQVGRRATQHWAFAEDDARTHAVNNDVDYFLDRPLRLEQLPHRHGDSTTCLLSALLNHKVTGTGSLEKRDDDEDHHSYSLWQASTQAGSRDAAHAPVLLQSS
ncbi:hypothetical protein [Legionella sp. CNM-4043-24]|uniref:hypothetical protein n=1 Tax=Legionella sp. CNM-4043-24 TaxID=3421646 RepID=UPI00403B242B